MKVAKEVPDQQLLELYVKELNEAAFTDLARRHHGLIYGTAKRICGDHGEAQEVLQQCLVVLARRAKDLGHLNSLAGWLHRVATLEARNVVRKRIKRKHRELMAQETLPSYSSDEVPAESLVPLIDESLNSMSSGDREVLTLHYLEGRTFREVSAALGSTPEACRKRCSRALEKLTAKLKRQGVAVSTIALGSFFATNKASAALAPSVVDAIVRQALAKAGSGGIATAGSGLGSLLLSIKMPLLLCALVGASAGSGMTALRHFSARDNAANAPLHGSRIVGQSSDSDSRTNRLGLDSFRRAISQFDQQASADAFLSSRLQSLMFLVSADQLGEVFAMLEKVEHPDRFPSIVASFFGRWAELDRETALVQSSLSEHYPLSARRGVILTWMQIDTRECLDRLVLDSRENDPDHVAEYIAIHAETHPAESAEFVTLVTDIWPDGAESLVSVVGKAWCQRNPVDAVGWVSAYPDLRNKPKLLRELLIFAARNHGATCLKALDAVDDSELRRRLRIPMLRWWGISAGKGLVTFSEGTPPALRPSSFPNDWGHEELRAFVFGVMENNAHAMPRLLELATNDEQLQAVHEGILTGGAFIQPSQASEAVRALPDEMAERSDGEQLFRKWARRFSELEPDKAREFVNTLPAGRRRQIVLEEMQRVQPEP